MNQKKNYCADLQGGLWLQYNTIDASWQAKPCCMFGKIYKIKDNINEEFWQNPELVKLRQENLADEPLSELCKQCTKVESSGNYSRRMSWNDRLGTEWSHSDGVIELDIQADFTCNLACRICNSQLSTYWRLVDPDYKDKKFKVRIKSDNVAEILSTLPGKDIQQIHFQGGEPLLTRTHQEILNRVIEKNDPKNIVIWYHSNGTVKVDQAVKDLWEKFKRVEIYFSIDDMGPRMEYQRWPVKWEDLVENLLWWKENLPHNGMLRLERTVGVLTAGWLQEFDQWATDNFSQTKYGDPITISYHHCTNTFSPDAVSTEYRDYVLQNTDPAHWVYKDWLNLKTDNEILIRAMLSELDKHDLVRGHSWKDYYPEFMTWYARYL